MLQRSFIYFYKKLVTSEQKYNVGNEVNHQKGLKI